MFCGELAVAFPGKSAGFAGNSASHLFGQSTKVGFTVDPVRVEQ
jgi:hypothetical protein